MAVSHIRRGSGLSIGQRSRPNANPIYVDSSTEEIVTGTGASGTSTRKVPKNVICRFNMLANASLADQCFFIANRAYTVKSISYVHSVAGNDAGAVNLQVTKDTATDAPGAGTDLLTNNANAGFDCKATANTVQNGTLVTTAAVSMAAGDRLSVDFAGTLTTLAGVVISVELEPA